MGRGPRSGRTGEGVAAGGRLGGRGGLLGAVGLAWLGALWGVERGARPRHGGAQWLALGHGAEPSGAARQRARRLSSGARRRGRL